MAAALSNLSVEGSTPSHMLAGPGDFVVATEVDDVQYSNASVEVVTSSDRSQVDDGIVHSSKGASDMLEELKSDL